MALGIKGETPLSKTSYHNLLPNASKNRRALNNEKKVKRKITLPKLQIKMMVKTYLRTGLFWSISFF